MMRSILFFFIAAALVPGVTRSASAQDVIAGIIQKKSLSRNDLATMEAEISQRVKRLASGANPDQLEEARDRMLKTAQTSGASEAGLDAYVEISARELAPLVSGGAFDVAFHTALLLNALHHVKTIDALAQALSSKHDAIRYMAAKGIQRLHRQAKDRQAECQLALRTLGRAGASERDEHVLRAIYQAIDFPADVSDFAYGQDCAGALLEVFGSRARAWASGSRDELKDEAGLEAAARCYASASDRQKSELVRYLSEYLGMTVDRYFDDDTAPEYRRTLAALIGRTEEIIRGIMEGARVTVPSARIALNPRAGDQAKEEKGARSAMSGLLAVLRGPPWNIP